MLKFDVEYLSPIDPNLQDVTHQPFKNTSNEGWWHIHSKAGLVVHDGSKLVSFWTIVYKLDEPFDEYIWRINSKSQNEGSPRSLEENWFEG